ncbi:MAG: Ig-like domain-containing protein [Mobilitalea sp.]
MKRLGAFLCMVLLLSSILTPVQAATTKKDTKAPVITNTNPVNYATNVMVESTLLIRFNETVKKGKNIAKITLKEEETKKVTFTYEISDKFIKIKPKTTLKYNTSYTVTIPAAAVKDAAGNSLAKAYTFQFITEADPTKTVKSTTDSSDLKYVIELEVSMKELLSESMLTYVEQMLKKMGINAKFKDFDIVLPTVTPKPTTGAKK